MDASLPGQLAGAPWTASQSRSFDRAAEETLGVPGEILMENAGASVARAAFELAQTLSKRRIVIICGIGNNGGDGFVAARHLAGSIPVEVFLVGTSSRVSGDAARNLERLRKLPSISIRNVTEIEMFEAGSPWPDALLVDALFGTGLDRPVSGLQRSVIESVNASGAPILAVDIPSGLAADTGAVQGAAVRAHATVTFVATKTGFFRERGPEHTGKLMMAGIGVPASRPS
ncbi:MAG: NAD(P)H-hydrate epimerase [Planctomycetes bacterium]|nr:NAD(P)H-hydrate epimerase [Planctomycetota bacterium]